MELDSEIKTPLVSVIIPAYNASEYIREAIESVLSQSYPNIEIIVVDDGSTDNTKVISCLYGQKINYCYQDNAGVSAARNAGILLSRGEYITCLDADDIMHEDKILLQIDLIRKDPKAKIVFTDYINFEKNNSHEKTHFQTCDKLIKKLNTHNDNYILKSEEVLNIMVEENFSLGSNPLYNKSALNKVGLYDCFLSQGEDFEFHYRFAKNYNIGIINKVLLYRRLHECNTSKKVSVLLYKAGLSRNKILLYENDKILRDKLKTWIRNIYLDIAGNGQINDLIDKIKMIIISCKYGISKNTLKTLYMTINKHICNNKTVKYAK